MKIFDATSRYIYEDIRFMYGTMALLYITLPLAVLWITLGAAFNMNTVTTNVFGPLYGLIISYGIAGYKVSLPIAVGLGSTRKQYLKSYFLLGIVSVLIVMVILNLIEILLMSLYQNGTISVYLMDTGRLFFDEYNFFSFVGVDISLGLFLFGLTSLITSIFYRMGFLQTAILFVAIIFIVSLLLQLGSLDGLLNWVMGLQTPVLLSIGAIAGVMALIGTYPIMLHAPLESKSVRS